jgi:CheY-like chemotaxis protein
MAARDFNPVGLKVLVLESDPGEATIVESQLQGLQYTVTVAGSVKEALTALETSSSFDVALVAAPVLSGGKADSRALLRKLKSLPFVLTGEGARPAEVRKHPFAATAIYLPGSPPTLRQPNSLSWPRGDYRSVDLRRRRIVVDSPC